MVSQPADFYSGTSYKKNYEFGYDIFLLANMAIKHGGKHTIKHGGTHTHTHTHTQTIIASIFVTLNTSFSFTGKKIKLQKIVFDKSKTVCFTICGRCNLGKEEGEKLHGRGIVWYPLPFSLFLSHLLSYLPHGVICNLRDFRWSSI